MSDRKAELERKKAKLEAMRAEKKRKEEERRKQQGSGEEAGIAPTASPVAPDLRTEAEQMLKDLGIPDVARAQAGNLAPGSPGAPVPSKDAPPVVQMSTAKKINLSVSKVTQTHIPPKETVSYSKETQTPVHETQDREARPWDYYALTYVELDDDNDDSLEMNMSGHGAGHQKMPPGEAKAKQAAEEVKSPKEEEKPAPVREFTEDEIKQIEKSEDYHKFIDRTSRIVERALTEFTVDVFTDYTGEYDDDSERRLIEGEMLKLNRTFWDERWSKHRTVTCLDWSVQHPELLIASYNNNEESPHEPDGVALMWNLKYKKSTPEYIFHYQSAVMSTCFAKFHPNLIVGGTYSGQIVLWDNRANKRTPVQRTPLSAAAHTHPVYCVNVVGTQNAHNLISVSTDGKMCSWNLDMLSQPQDSMELQHKQSKAVAVTCFSFLHGDVNNFVVGSEEGAIYTACRHGSKAGISDMFEGHQGPLTGVDCHATSGSIDFSQYFLTSSFDWTVKLWNIKENKPLHSFEDNSDYVYDARWSPIHPALFATVDGSGRLDLWNLNNDTEVPTASVVVEGQGALNKCRWHQNGNQIVVGDDMGKIHIYDVNESLATPKHDEYQRFVHTLGDLKTEQTEQEDEANLNLMSSPYR